VTPSGTIRSSLSSKLVDVVEAIEVEVEEPLVTEVDPDAPVDVVAWLVDV
jgi:hypothetical protein